MARKAEKPVPVRTGERMPMMFEPDFGWGAMESPWRMMRRMRDHFDRMLSSFGLAPMLTELEAWRPSVDLFETDDEVVVRADIPGVDPSDVEVTATEDSITIRGEMKQEEEIRERGYYCCERRAGSFQRSMALPVSVVPDQAKASFKDGVLEVHLPKVAEAKSRAKKIPIARESGAGEPKKRSAKKAESK